MTTRTRYFVISSLLVTTVGIGTGLVAYYMGFPLGAFTSTGGPDELRYVPRDVAVVAYADVRAVMASDLRQRLRRVVPGQENGQRDFQELTGINIETDIEHVVASLETPDPRNPTATGGLVLARGVFNEEKIQALMREHGGHAEQYRGKWLMVAPSGKPGAADPAQGAAPSPEPADPSAAQQNRPAPEVSLSFLEPGLVAIGTSRLIHRSIDLGAGGDNVTTNEQLMGLIRSLDSGNAWAVGRFDALKSSGMPQGLKDQLPPITWFSVTGQVHDGLNGVIRAEASTDEAAKNLREVAQGFIALARLQAGSKPELQAVIQSLNLGGTGTTVALSFSVPGTVFDLLEAAGSQPRRKEPAH